MGLSSFDQLIGEIYEASTDAEYWPRVLHAIREKTQSSSSAVGVHSLLEPQGRVPFSSGLDPLESARYGKFSQLNPWLASRTAAARAWLREGTIGVSEEAVPYRDYQRTEFYAGWGRKNGVVHLVGCTLTVSPSELIFLTLHRSEKEGLHLDDTRTMLEALAPHLRRSMRLLQKMQLSDACRQTTESRHTAVFTVSADGTLLDRNVAGAALLGSSETIQVASGRLQLRDVLQNRHFQHCVKRASLAPGSTGEEGMRFHAVEDGCWYSVMFLPARAGFAWSGAPVTVVLERSSEQRSSALARAVDQYGLSPAESRLLALIADGCSMAEAARRLGLSRNTLKTQMTSMFRKTESRRQAELLARVLGLR